MLNRHLPSQDEMVLNQALALIQSKQHHQALPLLLSLPEELKSTGDVKLALADCFIESQQYDAAKAELESIPLEYKA